MLAVASSRITTLFFLRIARQMQINCFSPTDTLLPPSSIRICKPVLLVSPLVSNSSRPALFRRPKSYVFENLPSGSRFLRKVSLNSTGSWGITVSLDLKSLRFIYLMLAPSIKISPSEISMILLNARATVDFPAPLLPHKPTFCPFWILRLSPFKTFSKPGLYLRRTF